VEVIIAPAFSSVAIEMAQTKPNCRLLTFDSTTPQTPSWEIKSIEGGLLLQSNVITQDPPFEIVTEQKPDEKTLADLRFAWEVCKSVKSNAIVLAKDGQTLGIGAGQTSRVFSLEIACLRA